MFATTVLLWGIIVFVWWYVFTKEDPPRIVGRYSRPGKWFSLKYYTVYMMLLDRQLARYLQSKKQSVAQMEKVQELPPSAPKAVDAVFLSGSSKDKKEPVYLAVGAARRHNNIVETFLLLKVPNAGTFELVNAPETSLKADKRFPEIYAAGGVQIAPVEPMKRWRLSFKGKLKRKSDQEMDILKGDLEILDEKTVTIEMEWYADTDYFDFDHDPAFATMARAIAREPWSRKFWKRLGTLHQTHYEQFGTMTGTIQIEGHEQIAVQLKGMRDHSYGNIRDWAHLHRYIFTTFHTDEGTCGCIAIVSMPDVGMSLIDFGYIFDRRGKKMAVDSVLFNLHEVGETQKDMPNDYQLQFWAGGKRHDLRCLIEDGTKFKMGAAKKNIVYERTCRFVFDGSEGWGFSEWNYRIY